MQVTLMNIESRAWFGHQRHVERSREMESGWRLPHRRIGSCGKQDRRHRDERDDPDLDRRRFQGGRALHHEIQLGAHLKAVESDRKLVGMHMGRIEQLEEGHGGINMADHVPQWGKIVIVAR